MNIRICLNIIFLVVCLVADALAFSAKPCEARKDWSQMETTAEKQSVVSFNLDEDNITLGKPFSFNIELCSNFGGKPDRVTANAIMPAHQHGMNYTPTVAFDEKSQHYGVSDFLFHMPGVWEITVSIYRGDTVTHHTKDITIN